MVRSRFSYRTLLFSFCAYVSLVLSLPCQAHFAPLDDPNCHMALEFEQAYQQILQHAFELRASEAAIEASKGSRLQAGAYPNPELAVTFSEIGSDDYWDENELSVELVQLVELGGKRSARLKVADAQQCSTEWDSEIIKCQIFGDLLHSFISVAAGQERVALAQAQLHLAEQAYGCISAKSEAGKASIIETKKSDVACKTAKLNVAGLRANLNKAKKQMLTLWDCHPPMFSTVRFSLYNLMPPPAFEELACLLTNNPEAAKAQAELVTSQEAVTLERATAIPDMAVQVGVTTERWTREPAANIGFSIALPVFDQNRGNIYRAKNEHVEAYYNQLNTICHLQTALTALYEEWGYAYDQAMILKDTIMPAADESYSLAQMAYEEGKFDYASLLEARSTLFDVQEKYLNAVEEYHHRRADVLKITAQCCPSLVK